MKVTEPDFLAAFWFCCIIEAVSQWIFYISWNILWLGFSGNVFVKYCSGPSFSLNGVSGKSYEPGRPQPTRSLDFTSLILFFLTTWLFLIIFWSMM